MYDFPQDTDTDGYPHCFRSSHRPKQLTLLPQRIRDEGTCVAWPLARLTRHSRAVQTFGRRSRWSSAGLIECTANVEAVVALTCDLHFQGRCAKVSQGRSLQACEQVRSTFAIGERWAFTLPYQQDCK